MDVGRNRRDGSGERESESRGNWGRMTKSEGKREMIRVAGGVECLEEGG